MAELSYRRATQADLPAIIALLTDDILGASREVRIDDEQYLKALAEIDADPNQFLCVVEEEQEIIGTLQLTFIPGLARGGAKRGQIEAVRVADNRRGEKIGEVMFAWAIEECRSHGCSLIQLTTDKQRPDAHRFYEKLGFKPSHIGYKLEL